MEYVYYVLIYFQNNLDIPSYLENFISRSVFLRKLGFKSDLDASLDNQLIIQLLNMMEQTGADFTMTFRELGDNTLSDLKNPKILTKNGWSLPKLATHRNYEEFIKTYGTYLEQEKGM